MHWLEGQVLACEDTRQADEDSGSGGVREQGGGQKGKAAGELGAEDTTTGGGSWRDKSDHAGSVGERNDATPR